MPIVFVHGVNNREGDEYRDNEAARNGFLREIVAPALGLSAEHVHINNPYWGGEAATFAWNMGVLPDPRESSERFGAGRSYTEELVAASRLKGGVADSARLDFAGTVELLYGATLAAAESEEQSRAIAKSYLLAQDYLRGNPSPPWRLGANDENFADLLNYHVHAEGGERFGPGGLLDTLKEGLSRLANTLPAAGSDLLVRLARTKLNTTVTRFVGDAFVYLARRGEPAPGKPGPIVEKVLAGLQQATDEKTPQDNHLIVIAHSFGGEIVYDILTTFDRALKVDCLITVGSQVGLFEELKLYKASKDDIPLRPPEEKAPMPSNLKRWLNVFDRNDVLSYRVAPVFDQATDFEYETGYGSLQAHGGYFMRPSFYLRVAERLRGEST